MHTRPDPARFLQEQAVQRINKDGDRDTWSLRQKAALACRILADEGHGNGLAGQITVRAEHSGTFYTQRLGFAFHEITASNLLLVDEELNVLEGSGMANPANRFHAWIYRARPEVGCVIHTHPFNISALSMLEQPLQISHMDTCILFEDCSFLAKWPGLPFGDEEGEVITAALGSSRGLVLGHHGLLSACSTVEEATIIAIAIERAAKLQLAASSAGAIVPIDVKEARRAHDWLVQPSRINKLFDMYARQAFRIHSDCAA